MSFIYQNVFSVSCWAYKTNIFFAEPSNNNIICSATAWVVAWLGTTVTVIFLSLQYCLSIQSMLVEFRARHFTLGDFSSISDNRCGLFLPTVLGLNAIMSASFESLVRSSKEPSSALSAKDTFPANSSL